MSGRVYYLYWFLYLPDRGTLLPSSYLCLLKPPSRVCESDPPGVSSFPQPSRPRGAGPPGAGARALPTRLGSSWVCPVGARPASSRHFLLMVAPWDTTCLSPTLAPTPSGEATRSPVDKVGPTCAKGLQRSMREKREAARPPSPDALLDRAHRGLLGTPRSGAAEGRGTAGWLQPRPLPLFRGPSGCPRPGTVPRSGTERWPGTSPVPISWRGPGAGAGRGEPGVDAHFPATTSWAISVAGPPVGGIMVPLAPASVSPKDPREKNVFK